MGKREAAAESAKGIFRVIGGALKSVKGGDKKDGASEDYVAQIEALTVQKKTLLELNRAREQEVINLRKHVAKVEESASERLRKVTDSG